MLQIQRILFPTDLSEGATEALPHAVALADWHGADLHVLNVTGRHDHSYEDMKASFPLSAFDLGDMLGTATGERSSAWEPRLAGLTLVQEQVESASVAPTIVEYAGEQDVDLIVMGTHGRRGVERLLMGSVTEDVVRTAPCPVFTIRAGANVTPKTAVRRILVPVDFSDATSSTLQHAKELALTYGAELNLLHVVEEVIYPSTYGVEPLQIPTEDVLRRVETALGDMAREEIGYEHVVIEATIGYAPTAILDYIADHDVDLTVIATHGRTGLNRLLMGSVAERVVRRAPGPVFVVKSFGKSLVEPPAQAVGSTVS